MSRVWFYQHEGKSHGPFTASEFKAEAASGWLKPETLIRKEGQSTWSQASRVQGLFSEANQPLLSQVLTDPQPAIKACPFCSENIFVTAIKCRFCGEFMNKEAHKKSTNSREGMNVKPLVSGLLSFLIPGAGQFNNHDELGGVIWFILCVGLYVFFFDSSTPFVFGTAVLLHLICIVSAIIGANK